MSTCTGEMPGRMAFPPFERNRRVRGMALIEVLVSLIVAGLFLSVILREATTALRRVRLSAMQSAAQDIARNRVEALSAWPAVLPSPSHGQAHGLQWKVEQIASLRQGQAATGAIVLRTFRVTVAVPEDPSPLLDLTIERLGWAP